MLSIKSLYIAPSIFVSFQKIHNIRKDFENGLDCKLTLMEEPVSVVIILDDGCISLVVSFFD